MVAFAMPHGFLEWYIPCAAERAPESANQARHENSQQTQFDFQARLRWRSCYASYSAAKLVAA